MSQRLRWTEDDLARIKARQLPELADGLPAAMPVVSKKSHSLRLPKPLLENEWEKEYWEVMQRRVLDGELKWCRPKAVTLNLSCGKYTPDFPAVRNDGQHIYYEVKGYFYAKDRQKFKAAIVENPHIKFVLVRKKNGAWEEELFG